MIHPAALTAIPALGFLAIGIFAAASGDAWLAFSAGGTSGAWLMLAVDFLTRRRRP